MPAKRLSMRKIKDVLRLCWGQGLSKRKAAGSCGVSRPTVDDYLRRAEAAGLSWPLPAEMDDGALERLLFPPPPALPDTARGVPDWSEVHRELKRPGVTLQLLWHEYRQTHPHGYQYTWFCRQYRTWRGKLDLVMRQSHRAGEKLFVDYAGMRAQVINPTYQDLATHYGVAIVPARVRRPRDKAKAEVGVQVVERWILAALRHRQCFSLAELNRAIRALLETLNNRPFKKLPGTRRALFEQLDKPALRPLPVEPYEYAEWKQARVHIDYHVEVHGHYYSVPHALIKKQGQTCVSPPTPSSASIAASASPVIDARTIKPGTPPSPPTCPSHTARPVRGPRNAWGAGRRRSGRPQKPLSAVSCLLANTPSRPTAAA